MGIREAIEQFKQPVEAEVEGLGKVRFRRIKVREAFDFSPLEGREYDSAVLAASAQDENGINLFASPQEVSDLPWIVFRRLRAAYHKANPSGTEDAAKK